MRSTTAYCGLRNSTLNKLLGLYSSPLTELGNASVVKKTADRDRNSDSKESAW